jgi:uncharacterized OsmC-like protein
MEISEIKYIGNLRTESTHLLSKTRLTTDAPPDNEGKGESFSPTDLTCVSLATCMLTTMAIRARKNGFEMGKATARVTKVMQPTPRRIKTIKVEMEISEGIYNQVQKELLAQAAGNCPVALSLHPEVEQILHIVYKQ